MTKNKIKKIITKVGQYALTTAATPIMIAMLGLSPAYGAGSFSADVTMTIVGQGNNEQPMVMKSKYYLDGELFRVDNPEIFGMGPSSHITNPKKKMIYIIDHKSKTYEELPLRDEGPKSEKRDDAVITKEDLKLETYEEKGWTTKKIGKDKVENIPCTIFEASSTGSKESVQMCVSEKLSFMPLWMKSKNTGEGNMEMKLSNIKTSGVSADVFLPPKAYTKGKPASAIQSPADLEKHLKDLEKQMKNLEQYQQKRAPQGEDE